MIGIRSTVAIVAATAALAVGTAAGSAADLTAQEKSLIAGAKAEGAVTIIHPLFSDRTSTRMAAAFKKRYGLGGSLEHLKTIHLT